MSFMATNNFTLVTAFYRLDDNPIQSDRIRTYLESGQKLLNNGCNIVTFCEPDMGSHIRSLCRSDRSVVIPVPKSLLPNYRLLDKIRSDRHRRQYNPDPRNTPEYFALTCSKPWFVSKAVDLDLFGSSHFAWADFGLYKTCDVRREDLDLILDSNIDQMNVAILNSHSPSLLGDLEKYYAYGHAGLGGTFWSGSIENMKLYCDHAMSKFNEMVELGYGHADEQIMFQVYHENPELFRCYPADYISIIENNVKVKNTKNVFECLTRIKESNRPDLLNSCLEVVRNSGIPC